MGQALSSPTKNASPLSVRPRKLKRCASHIYICQLIKALQTRESNQTEQRSSETPQYRVPDPVTTTSDFKSNVAPSIRCQNPHLIDLYKTCNPKPVQEDQAQLSLELYGPKTTQKQVAFLTVFFCLSLNLFPLRVQNSFHFWINRNRAMTSSLSRLMEHHNLILRFQTHFRSILLSLQLTIATSHLHFLAIRWA